MPNPLDAGGTPSGGAVDRFEAAYTEGVQDEPSPAAAGRQESGRELLLRAAPAEAVALAGCVLTPDRAIEKGYVVVGAGKQIQAVTDQKPAGVRIHETDGVITPGLIDLHGHPEFNIFAAWEPPQQFVNRYAWRGSDLYKLLVREPQNKLLTALPPETQLRYAEIRALVGGVTAIQGTGGAATAYQDEALVRNVDKWIFGGQVARAMIDLPTATSRDMERLEKILAEIGDQQIKAFYLHLCEGRTDNQRSQDEFTRFIDLKALTPSTVVIHGTSLTREQLGQLKDGGAKLVWSPQSNLRLYGETTRAGDALDLGMLVGLGADWLPSGSTSLLSEMKVARRSLLEQGHTPTSKRLVAMVTSDAAKIAGLDDKLGTLAQDRPADLCVLERRMDDPWDNVVEADPSWVELVMIDGDLTYGRADWLGQLTAPGDQDRLEPLIAWGKPMLLDASYTAAGAVDGEQTKLAQLRAALIKEYPQVGPILA
jgi:5-methylthioadenosine/S-adenosylhomocysteine deaminase